MQSTDLIERRKGEMMVDIQEGDNCPDQECCGTMEYGEVENCSCHISPPCHHCVDNPLVCSDCGYTLDELEEILKNNS